MEVIMETLYFLINGLNPVLQFLGLLLIFVLIIAFLTNILEEQEVMVGEVQKFLDFYYSLKVRAI